MKSLNTKSKSLVKTGKKYFAGGSHAKIDYNLREFDVIFVGGLMSANTLKYLQHTGFHGTMAGFNTKSKFYNEHHYEYLVQGNIPPFKYMAMAYNSNYNVEQSAYYQNKIVDIKPNENKVIDDKGNTFTYKSLVLNTGLNQHYTNMPFLQKLVENDDLAHSRVFVHQPSNEEQFDRNRRIYGMHKDNDLIVYLPKYPSRREAYDAWYLGLDTFLSWGVHSEAHHSKMKIRVITPNENLFKFPFANEVVMEEISQRAMIETHFGYELENVEIVDKGINAKARYATFKNTKTGESMRIQFGTLLLTPNNKKRECFNNNDITDEDGQVKVNPYSLQHVKYPNIFAFGDCANVNTTKSFYASINQQVVVRNNLSDYLNGNDFKAVYNGYSSFAVGHSMDRTWTFSHNYDYKPSFGNFYVPRFLGLFTYKFKCSLEKQFFNKIFQGKPNFGYPYLSKNKYFRPIEENRFVKEKGLKREDIIIHAKNPPVLSFHHHHEHNEHCHHGKGKEHGHTAAH